jgi:2'-5' RNA ligase
MSPLYAIYFVPRPRERLPISRLRRTLCRRYKSGKALQYPVHLSLTPGAQIRDAKSFLVGLRRLCASFTPRVLRARRYTDVLHDRNWCGIHVQRAPWLRALRGQLLAFVRKHGKSKPPGRFMPHITLVYRTSLLGLRPVRVPVTRFAFDRLTVVRKARSGLPYRIYRHVPFG